MPYKDRVLQRQAVKKAVQKHRGITGEGITPKGITEYHPILYALTDLVKRKKLEAICLALKRRGLGGMVYYGMLQPIDFLVVGDLLEATQAS